jgi:hypothetical protein
MPQPLAERKEFQMVQARRLLGAAVAAGLVGGSNLAFASPAQSPEPTAGSPSCNGLIIAEFNHNSGERGHSGNPNASAGPGEFLGPATHEAIQEVRDFFC